MQSDEPTLPAVGRHEPGAAKDPAHLTAPPALPAFDAAPLAEAPTWPPEREHWSRASERSRFPASVASTLVLRISLGANLVLLLLLGLLCALVLSHLGALASGGPTGSSVTGAALSSPPVAASPTTLSGWLQVSPESVQLGCDGDQRTQVVVLANTGPQTVHWQAVPAESGSATAAAGISISPNQGDLDAGASRAIQLQNTTRSSGPQRSSGQQGVIRFAAAAAEAGTPPSLSYSTVGCH